MSFRIGDEVLTIWGEDGFLYPAILVSQDGDNAHVAYLDGDEADVPLAKLNQGAFGPGLRVNVNWKGRRVYYWGKITQRIGVAVFLEYEDGTSGWATIAQCRAQSSLTENRKPEAVACTWCGTEMTTTTKRCGTCGAARDRV